MDWAAYKKVLLDEYKEDYPEHSKEQIEAFYVAMTWLENEMDIDSAKDRMRNLINEKAPNLDKKVKWSFNYGLERMALAINELSSISGRLNDYIPERIHNEYLKKTLVGVKELLNQNEELKEKCKIAQEREIKAQNELKTWKQLSKADLKALRSENAYIELEKNNMALKNEIKELKIFRDRLLKILNTQLKKEEEV